MKVTIMSPQFLRLTAVALAALVSHQGTQAQFQSGPHSGAVFAASMVSDASNTYLAGVTYSNLRTDDGVLENPQCFVMDLESKDYQYFSQDSDPGNSCRDMTILSDQQIMVVGTSNPGGLYFEEANPDAVQVGFGMTLNRNTLDIIAGASLFSDSQVPYPEAVVADPSNPDIVYVASMTSRETTDNDFPETEFPNWTHLFRHGTHFEMSVQALRHEQGSSSATFDGILDGGGNTGSPVISTLWNQEFPVEPEPDGSKLNVYVGGMIYKEFVGLIVAGSTAAQGEAYGPSEGDDEDGYISILDPASGELAPDSMVDKNNQRFGTAQYDMVTNICDDPDDEDYFYIVGGTKGDMNGLYEEDVATAPDSQHAFIRKVYVPTLFEEWTAQHGAWLPNDQPTKATMWGCILDGSHLYAVGVVEADASMIQGDQMHTSKGGNDVFVVAYDKDTGDILWMNQVGSSEDEQLARNGAISMDASENVMIYGDTLGSIYRSRDSGSMASDLFHFTMNRNNGRYKKTLTGDTGAVTETIPGVPATNTESTTSNGHSQNSGSQTTMARDAQVHQSGPNAGAMYASSMVFDANRNEVIITGISYTASTGRLTDQPNCLVARIEVNSMVTRDYQILGEDDDALEACRDVATNGADIVVVGNSEPGGLFAKNSAVQTGFGFTLSAKPGLEIGKGASLFGGETIPYPQAVVVDGTDVYVASMNSNDVSQNMNQQIEGDFPNWTHLNKYGQGFVMTIEKLSLPNYNQVWQATYPVDAEADGSIYSVNVGGLIHKTDRQGRKLLVAVGSTRAKGEAYGPAEGSDADGYITLINPSNGKLMADENENNVRIGSAADDVIAEVCDNPDDPNSIIVVGATKGDIGGIRDSNAQSQIPAGSLQWFAMKVNLTTLRQVWTIQGGAVGGESGPTSVFASGCHVDKGNVFVAGNVQNGASVQGGSSPQTSKGGSDVWVAALDLSNGDLDWISQIGSEGDDGLARNGGISADASGNVIIFGDTTGDLYRDREVGSNADLFLAVLKASSGQLGTKYAASPVDVNISIDSPTRDPTRPSALDSLTDNQKKTGAIIGYIILALLLLVAVYCICQRSCYRRRRRNQMGKAPTNIYDAAAADLGYEDAPSRGNDGLFRKKSTGISLGGTNLTSYKDDPETDVGAMGNFHKTYSDLPQNGKEII